MKLWHDDIRRPPDDSWIWARTNHEAARILLRNYDNGIECEEISLDHDMGLSEADPDVPDADMQEGWDVENDGAKLVQALIALNLVPEKVTTHSWNYDGARRMYNLLKKAGHEPMVQPYVAP